MAAWLTPALLSLFFFGLWGLFTKLTMAHIDYKSALVYQTFGVLIIGFVTLSMMNVKPAIGSKGLGLSFAILTGLAYAMGCLFYFIAASKGKITTVVTLTSLYPLITILLAFIFLKEGVNARQCVGIVFAIVAIGLLSL